MSFGQTFAYSKTKEQDIALMLTAGVRFNHLKAYLGARWYWELLKLDGPLHVQAQRWRNSHHQPR